MLKEFANFAARLIQYRDYSYFNGSPAQFGETPERVYLILSVDVEASPCYQCENHVEELIWGRFGKREIGINRIMDLAEARGQRLTFFVDYCEQFRYPGQFEKITQAIQSRGHDLQLHAHLEFLPEDFWSSRGLAPGKVSLSDLPYEKALELLKFLIDSQVTMGNGSRPVAFRGGNFRYSKGIIAAMAELGLALSFNYNIESTHQPNNRSNLGMFRWSNGVVEVPLAAIRQQSRIYPYDFNEFNCFANRKSAYNFLAAYHRGHGDDAPATLLMHSWSFCHDNLNRDSKSYKNEGKLRNFEKFLKYLPDHVKIITASELQQLLAAGTIRTDTERDIKFLDKVAG